jgi:eukaryotic-like serine/threonine-protein kinase
MTRTIGHYRIAEKLGEGGMGVVYAAEDTELGRRVALKLIHEAKGDAVARERMRREARAAAGVNHPGVCQVYEVGEEAGELYLAMELLEGEALADRIARGASPRWRPCTPAASCIAT